MTRTYEEFEDARATRRETLALVEKLGQEQSEHKPGAEKWSVGEVLDHLLHVDAVFVREIAVALDQRRRGLPFVYRGLADVDSNVPWVLRPILPFLEVPFGLFNVLVPPRLRRFLIRDRRLPGQAPRVLWPRFGRPIGTLREELLETFRTLEEQQRDHPDFDLDNLYYYNSIVGLQSIPGMYRFAANHEKRHQEQLREILDDEDFPEKSPPAPLS
jgi:hypothetical protein